MNENEELREEAVSENKKKNNKDDSVALSLYDWLQCLITAIVAAVLIFVFLFRIITVDGSSMTNTLVNGDMLIVSKLFYEPEYGDIVILKASNFGDTPLVKRVIATEGQTVDIDFDAGIVYVDGVALDEPYTRTPTNVREDFYEPVTVPEDCVFVMGDNRNGSTDSRTSSIGCIDKRAIIGKAYFLLIPGTNYTDSRDFSRIGSVY